MKNIPVRVIDAPRRIHSDGSSSRPRTIETLIAWLNTNPAPGTCLFISNQTFCGYQDAIAQVSLPASFSVETVGPCADENASVAVFLDNLARWIYQERDRRSDSDAIPHSKNLSRPTR